MMYKFEQLFKWSSGKPIVPTSGLIPIYGSNGIIGYTDEKKYHNKIILGRVGAYCGSVAYCPDDFNATDNTLITSCDEEKIDYYFAYYLLKQYKLNGFAGGSAQPLITQGLLKHLKCDIPTLDVQKKIVHTLSAYDNLIENNNKRIKILEQMAENLYKEWFVRFRFPGHETTPIENGIPKGWEISAFSKNAEIMSGGTPSTDNPNYYDGNIPFFTPKDCDGSYYTFKTLTNITEDGLNHCNSQLYPENTIIITARGTVGNIVLLAKAMAMNQSCFALKSDRLNNQYYLFFALKNEVKKLRKMANGGVFDTIIVKTFDHISLVIPSDNVLKDFGKRIEPIMKLIKEIQSSSINLIKQRDLLLPRLMSGKLAI